MTVFSPPEEYRNLEEYVASHPRLNKELVTLIESMLEEYTSLWVSHYGMRVYCPHCQQPDERYPSAI